MSHCCAVRDLPQAGYGRRSGRSDCSNPGQITFRAMLNIEFCVGRQHGAPANSRGISGRSAGGAARARGAVRAMFNPRRKWSLQMARSLRFAGWSLAMLTAVSLTSGSASAQIGGIAPSGSALGMTSPLGIGPAPAVPRTGIPMGATELSTPGVSPMTSGTSPVGAAPGNITTCSSIGGSLPQASSGMGGSIPGISSSSAMSATGAPGSSALFDGGGTMGNASGTCMGAAGGSTAGPASSASSPTGMGLGSPVGRVGVPLGSTELGVGGLSPPPDVLTVNPTAPAATSGLPCPTGAPSTTGMSSGSC
jgi:hypothetical protein